MPTIPTYDTPQVAPGGLPAVRFTAPDTQNAAAEQSQQLGQAVQRASAVGGQIATDMALEANRSRLTAAVTEYTRQTADLELEALQLRGNDALQRPGGKPLPIEYGERASKVADEIGKSLGNDAQRVAFAERVAQMRVQLDVNLTRHVIGEQKAYTKVTRAAQRVVEVDTAGKLWGDTVRVQTAAETIRASVDDELAAEGLAGDTTVRSAKLLEEMTPLHAAVLDGMVDGGRLDLARDYYQRNSAEMTLQARDRAMKVFEAGDFEAKTQDLADTIYGKYKGDIREALAYARASLSGKEEDAVVTRLKGYDAERVALRERDQRDAADKAWRVYADTHNLRSIPATVLASMAGEDYESLQRTARADADAAREKREVKTDPDIYYTLTLAAAQDPSFKNKDLRRYFDRLSPADRKHFIDIQGKASKNDGGGGDIANAQQQITATVKALGLKNKEAGLYAVEANKALVSEQRDKGRALNQDERQKVLDRLALRVNVPGVLWGSESYLFAAGAEGKSFTPEFTKAQQDEARLALQRKGVKNPTKQQIDSTLKLYYGVK